MCVKESVGGGLKGRDRARRGQRGGLGGWEMDGRKGVVVGGKRDVEGGGGGFHLTQPYDPHPTHPTLLTSVSVCA